MTDSETSELQPLVRAYLASALKEIEWQVSPDLGSEWLAGEIVDHRHWQHLVAVVRADERAKVIAEIEQFAEMFSDKEPSKISYLLVAKLIRGNAELAEEDAS